MAAFDKDWFVDVDGETVHIAIYNGELVRIRNFHPEEIEYGLADLVNQSLSRTLIERGMDALEAAHPGRKT